MCPKHCPLCISRFFCRIRCIEMMRSLAHGASPHSVAYLADEALELWEMAGRGVSS